jgi:hypothetical protein
MKAGDTVEEAQTQAQVAGGSKGQRKRQDRRLAVSHEEAMAIQVQWALSPGNREQMAPGIGWESKQAFHGPF